MKSSILLLCAVQEGRCFFCLVEFTGPVQNKASRRRKTQWTREHMFPEHAGYGRAGNIVLSCAGCNARKGGRMPTEAEIARMVEVHAKCKALGAAIYGDAWPTMAASFGEHETAIEAAFQKASAA